VRRQQQHQRVPGEILITASRAALATRFNAGKVLAYEIAHHLVGAPVEPPY
jgi:hypothetical protein